MADVTIYVPDNLLAEAREAGVLPRGFLSRIVRDAIEQELAPIRLERRRQRLIDHLERKR